MPYDSFYRQVERLNSHLDSLHSDNSMTPTERSNADIELLSTPTLTAHKKKRDELKEVSTGHPSVDDNNLNIDLIYNTNNVNVADDLAIKKVRDDGKERATTRQIKLKTGYYDRYRAPEWRTKHATISGVDFYKTAVESYQQNLNWLNKLHNGDVELLDDYFNKMITRVRLNNKEVQEFGLEGLLSEDENKLGYAKSQLLKKIIAK